MESLPHIPDLVLHKILALIPTKRAVQTCFLSKQWQYLVDSPSRTLDFDERDDVQCHRKFIEFVEGYLSFRNKVKKEPELHKLRLHTRMFSVQDDCDVITKLLEYACERGGLKDLDICTATQTEQHDLLYPLPVHLLSRCGEYLTSLKLECVQLSAPVRKEVNQRAPLFPCLKIMSLKSVRFATVRVAYNLLLESPCVEHVSLSSCWSEDSKFFVSSPSLKYLQIKDCDINYIRVDPAFNLESFSYVSPASSNSITSIILKRAINLKHINVDVGNNKIHFFTLLGCHPALEGSIKSKGIDDFKFIDGYLSAKFSIETPRLAFDRATILVRELMMEQARDSTYIRKLVSFIESFSCCKTIRLYNEAFKSLTVPKRYRRRISAPVLSVALSLRILSRKNRDHDYDELKNSLKWMSRRITEIPSEPETVDIEQDTRKFNSPAFTFL